MATQYYIIEAESAIIDAKKNNLPSVNMDIQATIDAFEYECASNGSNPYLDNYNCWGTLYVNAFNACVSYPALRPLVDALARVFV